MNTEREGTVYAVRTFPLPWPPAEVCPILRADRGDCTIQIDAHPDGHLNAMVRGNDGHSVCSFHSQPITIMGSGRTILTVLWREGQGSIFLDGQELEAGQAGSTPRLIQTREIVPGPVSLDHASAAAACRVWVERRRTKFAAPANLRRDRRMKTVQEQANDLRDAILCLHDVRQAVQSGRLYLRGHLAAGLRALVYWERDDQPDRSYNPLLLRLASKADLPLPIFSVREPGADAPAVIHEANYLLTGNTPEMVQTAPGQELMDLQEWLLTSVLIERRSSGERRISVRSLIGEFANSLGSSHYDEDVSELLDWMQGFGMGYMNSLTDTLLGCAGIVGFLGDWVLLELEKRNMLV